MESKNINDMTEEEKNLPIVLGQLKARELQDIAFNSAKNESELSGNMETLQEMSLELISSLAFNYSMQQGKTPGKMDMAALESYMGFVSERILDRVELYIQAHAKGEMSYESKDKENS